MSRNRISNQIVQIARVKPQTGAATENSEYIDMSQEQEIVAYINTGVVETSVDAKLVQAKDSSGTDKKDVPNRAIAQITTDDGIGKIELRQDDQLLDEANGFTFVGLEIVSAGATTEFSGQILGGLFNIFQDGLGPQGYDQATEVVRETI